MLKICKEFKFEGAHALIGYDGKCQHIHGHSYKFQVCVTGERQNETNISNNNTLSNIVTNPKGGMVIDFSDLRLIVEEKVLSKLDHTLLLREDAPLGAELRNAYKRVLLLPFQPTCENLTLFIADTLLKELPKEIILCSVRLYESETAYAEWSR